MRAASAEAGGGPAAGAGAGGEGAWWCSCAACWSAAGSSLGWADDVAVVFLFLLRRAERGVGFGDADEALGGVGVFRVEVGMVGFGEFVELSV